MANQIPPTVKKCPGCGKTKSDAEFGKNKRTADGLACYCKPCFREVSKSSYRKRRGQQGKQVTERREIPEDCKYCPRCEEIKKRDEFGRNRSSKDGLTSYCKPCHTRVSAENKAKNHGSFRSYHLKRRYGVTEEQVELMTAAQGGICVICLLGPAKHVDHDHETGLFRGLLCFGCNGALGQFDDHPWRLREAARYLDGVGSHSYNLVRELGESISILEGQSRRKVRRARGTGPGTARSYHLWRKYGLEDQDVELLTSIQKGFCAICIDGKAEHVDHDHRTTAVRGLLCGGCNTGMGQFKDDPLSIRRASDYLIRTLIEQVPDGKGGMRPSFTLPDVDPVTVPLDGWEPYRKLDARNRKAIMDLRYELELPWESELV